MNVYEIDYQVNSQDSMVYFSGKDSSNLFRFFILGDKETYFPTKKIHSFP